MTGSAGYHSSQPESFSPNDKLIISIPLGYTYFIKPNNTIFEALNQSNWYSSKDSSVVFDNLPPLRKVVTEVNETYAQYGIITILNEFRITDLKLTVSIIGNCSVREQMYDIRQMLLKAFNPVIRSRIQVDRSIQHQLTDFLRQLSLYSGSSIYVTHDSYINVVGHRNQVKACENRIRLKIDDLNPQLFSDFLEVESTSLLPLIAGPGLANLKKLILDTHCNIYLPNLLPDLYYTAGSPTNSPASSKPKIFITGLRALVLEVKTTIADIIASIGKTPFMKQLSVLPLKREMLILERSRQQQKEEEHLETFDDLMYSTGCYIGIPPLGYKSDDNASGDLITFQGNSIEEVENAIDLFVDLLSGLYSTKSEFICSTADPDRPVDINKYLNFCDTLASNSNVAVSSTKYGPTYVVQTLGRSESTRVATNYLSQLGVYLGENVGRTTVQFQLELPNEERDFIAGKKNGKLVKIANTSSVSVQLLPFTDHNFLVELSGESLGDAVLGLELLEEELPKSITFNVPESFHRQIIGVGGQTVQTIMRKYNVFIKFSNSFELGDKPLDRQYLGQTANFGQGFVRKNNVIIKCPSKNQAQIPLARVELERIVEKVTQNSYTCCSVSLSEQQWRLLTSAKFNDLFNRGKRKPTNFITELEKHTNTYIEFPGLDTKNYKDFIALKIYGSENSPRIACNELSKLLPYCYEIRVRQTARFARLEAMKGNLSTLKLDELQLTFLNSVVVPLRMLFNAELHLASENGFDIVWIHYFPTSFGYPFTSFRSERPSIENQSQLTDAEGFQQLLSSVKQFLNDCQFEVVSEQAKDQNLTVDFIESHSRLEKENFTKPVEYSKHRRGSKNSGNAAGHRFQNATNPSVLANLANSNSTAALDMVHSHSQSSFGSFTVPPHGNQGQSQQNQTAGQSQSTNYEQTGFGKYWN
ncbi:DEKNAAC101025 [Brettanomyces naardenensis]|uniref:DEKNAAC101025 n=1 Tax=Brettanomyces naardenensis TaxID=13370 RepID=A0A448YGS1_BRENA|nr:DEKNAAC101025 [Brettanomyces naardenensis]